MSIIPLEVGNLDGLFAFLLLIMIGPALLLGIAGIILLANKKKRSGKICLILAGVYLLISFGICGSMML